MTAGLSDGSWTEPVSKESCSWSMVLVGKGDWSRGEQDSDEGVAAMVTAPGGAEGELAWESSELRERLSLARAF